MNVARTLAAPAAAGVLALTVAGPASAHVTVSPTTTASGAYTVVTVSVPHGCEGSATTKVAIQIPEEILSVTPTRNAFWTFTEKQAKLAEPIEDAHGNKVTERDAEIIYTAKTPLPDPVRDTFELSLKLPEVDPGTVLTFPTVQTCEKGETGWVEVAAEGQDPHDLEHPAPAITVTAAEGEHGGEEMADDEEKEQEGTDGADDADENGGALLGGLGLGAGVLGLLAGGAALIQVRRQK